VTAWHALIESGRVAAGDTVLVQGTGGVAIFALQFAKLFGARAIVTSRSDAKLARARELGAWKTLNYETTPEWGRKARALAGAGVDCVLELGGAGTLEQSLVATRPGGRIVMIGMLSGNVAGFDITPVFMNQIRIQGLIAGHRESFEAMNRAIAAHALRPIVDRVFSLEEISDALRYLESGSHFGKICIRVG
jgi:NADPH:quinone reductase-like Zn-dependent oxidoreductase